MMGNIDHRSPNEKTTYQDIEDDNEAQFWEPPENKDEVEGVTTDFDECCHDSRWNKSCFFGKSEDANIRSLAQRVVQEDLSSKFKVIVSRLLNSANVSSSSAQDDEHWIEIIARLSWEAASLLTPIITGNLIDPNAYIKVKCLATGSFNESQVFKGLVFKKHATHKHMKTTYEDPKILLVKGALGLSLSRLSSFQRMSQEIEYTTHVDLIEASNPNVILVEKSVSRDLQEYILNRGVTLVSDMNLYRLQRILACIGPPVDSLPSHNLKQCQSFRIETIVEEHNIASESGKKISKTLMFLEGYPTDLGCTILLKGSVNDELKRVKKVISYSVALAYHLILETSFLLDQQAMFSSMPSSAPETCHVISPSSDSVQGYSFDATNISISNIFSDQSETSGSDIGDSAFSNGFSFRSPSKHVDLLDQNSETVSALAERDVTRDLKTKGDCVVTTSKENDRKQQVQVLMNTDDMDGMKTNLDIENVLDSPSIMVLVSKRNAHSGKICDPSQFSHIVFYKDFDVSLEMFLRDLFNQEKLCKTCGELSQSHFYYYAHHNNQLRIQLKRLPTKAKASKHSLDESSLWMWSRHGSYKTKGVPRNSTKRVMISAAARSLSFGKFLELSFAQQTLLDTSPSSAHSFKKEFLHFFGSGHMVAMFCYSQVTTYTAVLPPLKLEASSISLSSRWLEKQFQSVITKGILMFEEVADFLKKVKSHNNNLGLLKNLANIEEMLKEESFGFEENIKNGFDNAKTLDGVSHKLLRLNRMQWELLLQALVWSYRMQSLVSPSLILSASKQIPLHGAYAKDKDLIEVSNIAQELARVDPPIENSLELEFLGGERQNQWFWIPFAKLRSRSIVDIEKEYMSKHETHVSKFVQENLPIVNKVIIEEGSRLHISLENDEYVVSDYEDELSSLISCALATTINDEKRMSINGSLEKLLDKDQVSKETVYSEDPQVKSLTPPDILATFGLADSHGKPKYSVLCLYKEDFCDLRERWCYSELDYIDSLSRCEQWDAKDEKKKSVFAKTLDDKFIIKEIKRIEYESFVKFGPEYFKYMKNSCELGNQTCLAKVLGIYQVTIRQPKSGKKIRRHNLMVMENLNFGRKFSSEYNLKGPLLTRFTTMATNGTYEVMLDQNFFKDMNNYPVYFSKVSKHNLQSAVKNAISFLNSVNVMDYSLLVKVDMERHELVCGIINYLKQFTWNMSYPCHTQ